MKKRETLGFLVLLALIIFVFFGGIQNPGGVESILNSLKHVPAPAFILLVIIWPILFLPITPLFVTSGVIFGPLFGPIYALIGTATGAAISFALSKYLFKGWVDKKSGTKTELFQKRIAKSGWKYIIFITLVPILPFNVQSYFFGLSDIRLKTFFFATLIGLIPGTFGFAMIGHAGSLLLKRLIT